MTLWNVGDQPRLKMHFALSGVGTDPTNTSLAIQAPDNTVTNVTPIPDGSGNFHYDLLVSLSGIYRYKWAGTGAVVDTEEGEIVVVPSILGDQPPALIAASDIVLSAFRIIKVTGRPGRSPSQEQMAEGINVFNSMIDMDRTNGFMSYATARTVFPLISGIQDYLIGPTVSAPNFNMARPPDIQWAGVLMSGDQLEIPLEVTVSSQRWAAILKKDQIGQPWALYYEKTIAGGNGTIHLWMNPSSGFSLALYTPENQERVVSLTTLMNLPPGYQQTYEYNLAQLLVGRYKEAEMSAADRAIAHSSRMAVISANHQPLTRTAAFQSYRTGRTNIYSGGGIGW